ncbi:MAG: hypothetical protein GY863_17675 [bacterium]|nr:hypothetical protein [bacterium]
MNILDNMDYSAPGTKNTTGKDKVCPECGSSNIDLTELDKIALESAADFIRIMDAALPMIKRSEKSLCKCLDCGKKWKS